MGVIYKLKNEVVDFIISQRQGNPLFSCRQLAESASQKFGVQLSKSSVHDVLKESGIITPRGRKPKNKFEIPQEKKKQIQVSLSQVKLLPASMEPMPEPIPEPEVSLIKDIVEAAPSVILSEAKDLKEPKDPSASPQNDKDAIVLPLKEEMEISAEYEGAGKIFLKAALWDLGIFSEDNIKATDWEYYLTYTKGIKLVLENKKELFIDRVLPIERCIREVADGLVNNIRPLIVSKTSDENLFKATMESQTGFKIKNVSIVEQNNHILIEINDLMEFKREFSLENILIVHSNEKDIIKRSKTLFFSQIIDNNELIDSILNLNGFDSKSKHEIVITLIINDSYSNKMVLQEAVDKLNRMFIRDEESRLLRVVILSEAKDLKEPKDSSASPQNDA